MHVGWLELEPVLVTAIRHVEDFYQFLALLDEAAQAALYEDELVIIYLDPARKGRLGSVGQFGWSGAASTYFSIDPKERMISILLLQHLPNGKANDLPRISTPFYNLVYQALLP